MEIIKSYKELCSEIKMWEYRVEAYKAEIKALKRLAKVDGPSLISGIDYSQPNVKGSGQLGFEDYLFRLRQIESHIYLHEETIKNMTKSKEKIKEKLKELEGIDKKVVLMRDIEGMTLMEIAIELGYSEIYIKKISARNPKDYT